MIEASQIDWYGHDNLFKDQLNEMKDYEDTLNYLLNYYKENKDNLMILTLADHDCGGLTLIDYEAKKFDDNFKIHYSTNYHTAEHIPAFYKGIINFKINPVINNIEVFSIMKKYLFDQ
jgi:alkaline phosphatase